ncbi:MAG: CPBP family intramembrane glutamic endopeptidase [Gemmataceae bacterium]
MSADKKTNNWPILLLAMAWPSLMSWMETGWILPTPEAERSRLQTNLFVFGKVFQFALPVVFVLLTQPALLWPRRPRAAGLGAGALFALVVAGGMALLYFGFLRDTPLFEATAGKMREWLHKFGLDNAGGFLTFAVGLSVVHSLLEEYYWRWFVFGRLRGEMPWLGAAAVSGLAFMSHHVIVLTYYLPGYFWIGVAPFSLCVAVGGFVWAVLYHKYDNLYAAWLSHLLIDAAIMGVGWDLLER